MQRGKRTFRVWAEKALATRRRSGALDVEAVDEAEARQVAQEFAKSDTVIASVELLPDEVREYEVQVNLRDTGLPIAAHTISAKSAREAVILTDAKLELGGVPIPFAGMCEAVNAFPVVV